MNGMRRASATCWPIVDFPLSVSKSSRVSASEGERGQRTRKRVPTCQSVRKDEGTRGTHHDHKQNGSGLPWRDGELDVILLERFDSRGVNHV